MGNVGLMIFIDISAVFVSLATASVRNRGDAGFLICALRNLSPFLRHVNFEIECVFCGAVIMAGWTFPGFHFL